ncbi:hypothetical protein J3D56_002237 [Erwinia persicina]|jgi:hypothetical protein|uniref:Contact-dependent growth inhibition system immunity protein n=2 Tax=Erwinia TaxID=551 RepID=A0ABV4E6U8_9GAMM|nr:MULTISPECIES: contact-dependent growth inhibition system immunity protein [Erwinia]MCP1438801.1 hypothetical protein [Erwinia persicina]MDN4626817.1 contact-dependent growth inhibition system immunity protein [Erwinia sp. PsM31]
MKRYESIRLFFRIFFNPDWGDTSQEIVNSYVDHLDGADDNLAEEIDDFLERYPDNKSANPALEEICGTSMAFLRPSPVEFLRWLSASLKQKRDG